MYTELCISMYVLVQYFFFSFCSLTDKTSTKKVDKLNIFEHLKIM